MSAQEYTFYMLFYGQDTQRVLFVIDTASCFSSITVLLT